VKNSVSSTADNEISNDHNLVAETAVTMLDATAKISDPTVDGEAVKLVHPLTKKRQKRPLSRLSYRSKI
jgi:hypothetical protein